MDYLVQIILACVGVIGGGSSVVMWVMFRKQTARIKNAEAVEKEVQSLRSTVDALQQQQEFYEKRLKAMQELVIGKDNYIEVISHDKLVLEVKHAKNKSAINRAHECEFCKGDSSKCPVLAQKNKNDDEYLHSIEHKNDTIV